jgi:hypothetical protein
MRDNMFDVNQLLEDIRKLVKKSYTHSYDVDTDQEASEDFNELTDLCESLDDWLSKGGQLPSDWNDKGKALRECINTLLLVDHVDDR